MRGSSESLICRLLRIGLCEGSRIATEIHNTMTVSLRVKATFEMCVCNSFDFGLVGRDVGYEVTIQRKASIKVLTTHRESDEPWRYAEVFCNTTILSKQK